MQRKQQVVESALLSKGFRKSDGDHHYYHYYSLENKKSSVFTKTSHGSRELSDDLISKMAGQCKLKKSEFVLLVDCPLSRNDYEKRLIEQGFVVQKVDEKKKS